MARSFARVFVGAFFVGVVVGAVSCGPPPRIPSKDRDGAVVAGSTSRFTIDDPAHQNWRDRSFLVHVPVGYNGEPVPVVVLIHAGGGNAEAALAATCKDWDTASCLVAVADREGFALVVPEGTPAILFANHRTWNSGGRTGDEASDDGAPAFRCVSGRACDENVDDVAFFDALLKEVKRGVAVDDHRVFVTGVSNGAAMAHRLGCERSTVYAAIAPVAGGNQVEAVQGCSPARPVPVLEVHGTDDPCWRFAAGADMGACEANSGAAVHLSIEETVEGWRARNGCGAEPVVTDVDDEDDADEDDGLTTTRAVFGGCINDAAVEFLVVEGGGHAWPGGQQYLGRDVIGETTTDWSANEVIWDFFQQHPLSVP